MKYRTVCSRIWSDDKFPWVSDDAKLVWFHVFTNPLMTPLGIYKVFLEALAAELRWPLKRYKESFQELSKQSFLEYDERIHVVWFPRYFHGERTPNFPHNPNVLKAWGKTFVEIPACTLKYRCYHSLKSLLESFPESYRQSFMESFQEPSSNTYPIPNPIPISLPLTVPLPNDSCHCQDIMGAWNLVPGVKPVRQLTNGLHKRIHARKTEMPSIQAWQDYLKIIAASAFLTGKVPGMNGQGSFRATLDWVAGPENMDKILQGKYDDVRTPRPPRKLLGSEYADVT